MLSLQRRLAALAKVGPACLPDLLSADRCRSFVRQYGGWVLGAVLFWSAGFSSARGQTIETPQALMDGVQVSLVASEPEIVTPIGCRFDRHGRLFVIESHTHFPPEQYGGPKADRIKTWVDSNGDGSLDRMRVFYEGTQRTMGLAIDEEDWVYLITRAELLRLRDVDGDGRADQRESLVKLDTEADYPHNGLGGICLTPEGRIVFGLGENFGAPYVLRGADGSELRGGGEGGNVFSCDRRGGRLEWIATGFWNPFGIVLDPYGRIIVAGNDPDSAPPNRLVHVVPGGDYGFQFRFGRSGIHPLQAWNGELPGTLPRISATGEAACAVLPFRNRLWVTSWGDNRIETHRVEPAGASIQATPEVAVVGSAEFRPVDMAVAPDGSLYVTDWVDRSYPVHGRGRIWRLQFADARLPADAISAPMPAEQLARRIRAGEGSQAEWLRASGSDDVFLRQAAMVASARILRAKVIGDGNDAADACEEIFEQTDGRARLAGVLALHWLDLTTVGREAGDAVETGIAADVRRDILLRSLRDPDPAVRLAAIRWVAERGEVALADVVRQQLEGPRVVAELIGPVVACLSHLEAGKTGNQPLSAGAAALLAKLIVNEELGTSARVAALRLLPADHGVWNETLWQSVLRTADPQVQREAIRHSMGMPGATEVQRLVGPLVTMARLDLQARLDALCVVTMKIQGKPASPSLLWQQAREQLATLAGSASGNEKTVAEVDAVLRRYAGDTDEPISASELQPESDSLQAWAPLVMGAGDAANGWRVFQSSRCSECHAVRGRGSRVGPELTGLGQTQSREQLLQSILEPSRDVGPLYSAWQILTVDGRTLTGIKLNGGGVGGQYRYLAADGTEFSLGFDEIETQRPAAVSLMPTGLHRQMRVRELRDLLEFLENTP